MKKTIKIIGIVFLFIVLLATVFVVLDECYGTVRLDYELSEDGSYYICTGRGRSDENFIKIPSEYKGKPVKEIGDGAFAYETSLKNVTLSNNITTIGQSAFENCSAMYKIDIEDSIETISGNAFEGCESLKYRTYKDGKYLGTIDNPCVVLMGLENTSVNSFTPEQSTKIIYYTAFEGCENLESLDITSNVTSFSIFYGDYNLQNINVASDNKVYSAVEGVLYNKAQTEILYVPTAISGAITIPNTVTTIESGTFAGCRNLENVTLPNSLTTIKQGTFTELEKFKGITLPSSVTTIEYEAFDFYLEYVNITDLEAWCNIDFIENYNPLIYADLYLNGEKVTDLVIPNSIKVINANAFLACKSIEKITFEDNSQLEKIGNGAFYDCINLTDVTFPNSLTSIEDYAFENCNKISKISIPDGIKTIGEYAFSGCTYLQSVTISASVTSIGKGAFDSCDSLAEINVDADNANYSSDNGVLFNKEKTILIKYCDGNGINIFYTIPNCVNSIDVLAFSDCDGLERITIPVNVTSIGNSAFYGCTALKDIYFTTGTKTQWNNISKGSSWDYNTSNYTIHCADGDVTKS